MDPVKEIKELMATLNGVDAIIDILSPRWRITRIHEQVGRLIESNDKLAPFHLGELNDEFEILLPSCPQLLISVLCPISSVRAYAKLMIRLPGDKYIGRKYFDLPDDGLDDDSDEEDVVFWIYSVDEFVPILNQLNRNFGQ